MPTSTHSSIQARASTKGHADNLTTHELNAKFVNNPKARAVVRVGTGVVDVQHFKPGEAYNSGVHEQSIELLAAGGTAGGTGLGRKKLQQNGFEGREEDEEEEEEGDARAAMTTVTRFSVANSRTSASAASAAATATRGTLPAAVKARD